MDNETMEVGEVEKGLGKLAEEINAEYRAFERDVKSATEHALRCGVLLEEKKASLGHGEWLPWLRDHFEGSERHAQRFMKLARTGSA